MEEEWRQSDEDTVDPLALQIEPSENSKNDATVILEPEIIIDDTQQLRRSKRCKNKHEPSALQQTQVELKKNEAVSQPAPLFPITPEMRKRIMRMKQRMLLTLQLSDKQLTERKIKRARQTQESRQRAKKADTAYGRKETDKKIARTKVQREMETAEQQAMRLAKKREEAQRYVAKRRITETAEQKMARKEYQHIYNKKRKPVSFV